MTIRKAELPQRKPGSPGENWSIPTTSQLHQIQRRQIDEKQKGSMDHRVLLLFFLHPGAQTVGTCLTAYFHFGHVFDQPVCNIISEGQLSGKMLSVEYSGA